MRNIIVFIIQLDDHERTRKSRKRERGRLIENKIHKRGKKIRFSNKSLFLTCHFSGDVPKSCQRERHEKMDNSLVRQFSLYGQWESCVSRQLGDKNKCSWINDEILTTIIYFYQAHRTMDRRQYEHNYNRCRQYWWKQIMVRAHITGVYAGQISVKFLISYG